ncbi:glycosyltransferase [Mycobacterium sp. E2479]|uniref:glycosyltransferase n=1 Tax=Mycobacterium sp. E2479 TaxID=1834134 RepID=UPI0007FD6568|nr:glycosyltransferase [Mycobacterium sp. E2479]OBH58697.1 glycosyl transferase family 1 [Mycobacterium sp. E2479]
MKIVLGCYGTRGDVEPCAALGRELLRRGHEVRMAVAPDLVGFVESVGLTAVACGPDAREWQDLHREFLTRLFRNFWKVRSVIRLGREDWHLLNRSWDEITTTLLSLADGADVLLTMVIGQESASDVAEYYDIPLALLHTSPMRPNGQLVARLPAPVARSAMRVNDWLGWPVTRKLENVQRRKMGLPKATKLWSRRIAERGSLELQAYDEVCFPGLAAEWAQWKAQRPFVGALTLELPTDADEDVASWIAAGTPPIFFGFGSTAVKSPADTIAMFSAACTQLGERALVCAAETEFSDFAHFENVKVVGTLNYAAIFPACRAVVHHGGAGTTAAGLRAGVPQLILSTFLDQTLWAAQVERLKVGTAGGFSTTEESLVADLRRILDPQYVARAREIATRMTKPAESVATAVDLLEDFARKRRAG